MATLDEGTAQPRSREPVGKAALIASVGGQRGYADWANPDHRMRRLLAEFLGMAGLTFILSGGAAILARYGGHGLQPWQVVLVLSAVSALWLVVAVYFLGDISAHFNPAMTLAFALRRDMGWIMAGVYWVVQFTAAACGSLLARAFFGPAGNLAATMPKPGQSWQAAGFEAIITFGLGHHGRPVRRRLDEPGQELRTRPGHREPVHLVGLPDRTRGRGGDRRRRGISAPRSGQGPGGRRGRGNAPPACHLTGTGLVLTGSLLFFAGAGHHARSWSAVWHATIRTDPASGG